MKLFRKPQTAIGVWVLSFVLVAAILTTGTVAWFVMNTEVSISSPSDQNLAVQVNAGDLEVSVSYKGTFQDKNDPTKYITKFTDYSPYAEEYKLATPGTQYIDVTGGGKSLWFPISLTENDDPIYDNPKNWDNVTDRVGYCVTLKAKFRTSQTMDVYLSDDSFVSGMEEIISTTLSRPSEYSEPEGEKFSVDGIAGAVRIAFLELVPKTDESGKVITSGGEVQYNEVLKTVWIPNDTYRLVPSGGYYTFTTTGEREETYSYWEMNQYGTLDPHTYTVSDYYNQNVMIGEYGLANAKYKLVNSSKSLLSFTADGTQQEKELLIRIWFEGTDSEASMALDGGKIKYNLAFAGINKQECSAEINTKIQGIRLLNGDLVWGDTLTSCQPESGIASILYSYDGIEWTPYGTGANSNLKIGTYTLYLKSVETQTSKSSNVYYVDVTIEEEQEEAAD